MRVHERVAARFRLFLAMTQEEAKSILGFPPNSHPSDSEIRRAQRARTHEIHPDRGVDPKHLLELNTAADVLLKKNDQDSGIRHEDARGGYGPSPGYTPPPKQKDVEVSFDEAKSKAGIPSNVTWWFVTESHSSGYSSDESTRRATGYVVVGETESSWEFVSVEHYLSEYYYVNGGPKTDVYQIDALKVTKHGPPEPAFLYGGVVKAWKRFEHLEKKFNSKIRPLPDGWIFGQRLPTGSSTTIKKILADKGLLSEEAAATIKTTVEMQLDTAMSAKPGFHPEPTAPGRTPFEWYKITLIINGRDYVLSEKDTQRLFIATPHATVSKFLNAVYGDYYHHGGKKVLTRIKDAKKAITWLAEKLTELPPAAKDALLATAERLK